MAIKIEEDRYKYDILAVAEQLHGEFTGSHDGWMWETLEEHVDWMRRRLENWTLSPPFTLEFDEAVRALCTIALREGTAELQRLEKP